MSPSRIVEFVVTSDTLTTAALVASLGSADQLSEPSARFPTQSSWIVSRSSGNDTPIDDLVVAVLRRVASLRAELAEARRSGAATCLRVIAYIGPREMSGPGFSLDDESIRLLAEVGAFLDADLYYSGPDDD